jgi:hypothetical protein
MELSGLLSNQEIAERLAELANVMELSAPSS